MIQEVNCAANAQPFSLFNNWHCA